MHLGELQRYYHTFTIHSHNRFIECLFNKDTHTHTNTVMDTSNEYEM